MIAVLLDKYSEVSCQKRNMSSSPPAEDTDPRPLPATLAPLPTLRTSSPDVNNFLDPLLSLTPDKPQRITKGTANGLKQRTDSVAIDSVNKENTRLQPKARRSDSGGSPKERRGKHAVSPNPGVLFHEERTSGGKPSIVLQRKPNTSNMIGDDRRKDRQSRESIAAAKVNKLTRAGSSGKEVASTKPAIVSHDNKGHANAAARKHVRIMDPKAPLASPKLHSTVAMEHQLRQLDTEAFDAEEVVMKTLKDSDSARLALSEKVAEAANVAKTEKKYSGLIGISVPVDETLQRAVAHRRVWVKRAQKPSQPSEGPPPDILDMFTPGMIMESANLDTSALLPPKVKPAPVDPDTTFDLYRHMQCWDLGL